MARLAGVDLPRNKRMEIALTYIYGVGRTRAAVVRLLDGPVAHYFLFSLPALRHLVDLIGGAEQLEVRRCEGGYAVRLPEAVRAGETPEALAFRIR